MKIVNVILLLSLLPIASTLNAQDGPSKTFDISKGVNVSHWLSQSKKRGAERAAYFTELDVAGVAASGMDHIRIPIDEEQMWDENGNKEKEAFALLHAALGWMKKYNLKAIVDLHIVRAHHFLDKAPLLFSDAREQQKFGILWSELSEELQNYPVEDVAYELLNESVAKEHADWNKVYRIAYEKVRANERNRVIFIGPNRWQQPKYFEFLEIPENDPNIVLSFHFYTPHPVTHYTASWDIMKNYRGPVHYPGIPIEPTDTIGLAQETRDQIKNYTTTYYDKDVLEQIILLGVAKAKELNLQLYCGEFGSYDPAPDEIRYRWFHDVISLFDTHDIAWSAWDLKSNGFGIFTAEDLSKSKPTFKVPRRLLFQN